MGRKADYLKRAKRWVEQNLADRVGNDYEPFFTVRDVPSRGRCHRIPSWTAGRIHHLLSDLEACVFYQLDYAQQIVDIREQYPLLPVDETVDIAAEICVRHPQHHDHLHVVTTDFLITLVDRTQQPIAVKYAAELEKKRTIQKLEIERIYWKRRNLQLRLMTERQVSRPLAAAVSWVHRYRDANGLRTNQRMIDKVVAELDKAFVNERTLPLALACKRVDGAFNLIHGRALSIARHAIAQRHWRLDLRKGIDTLKPLPWMVE